MKALVFVRMGFERPSQMLPTVLSLSWKTWANFGQCLGS